MKSHIQPIYAEQQLFVIQRWFKCKRGSVQKALLLFCMGFSLTSPGFDKLTKAQSLIYDTPHLSNTSDGQTITYDYSGESSGDAISDTVMLSISNASGNGKRDVEVEFLSEQRRLALPDFQGYTGNPVIIAMLEYIAKTLGEEAGGGTLYFRNRIRDALADTSLKIDDKAVKIGNKEVAILELRFRPFAKDANLANLPRYAESYLLLWSRMYKAIRLSITV